MKNLWVLLIVVLIACNGNKPINRIVPENWSEISKNAMGTSVNMMMWQGDPLINKYMTEWVVPEVKKRFNIDLKILPGQGNEIVKMLMTGIEQETKSGNVDICWINGETFYQLQQIDALYGPFVNILPNSKLIDFENPFIKYDFQQETKGFECPWGNVQECIIYDSIRTPHPPSNLIQLSEYVKSHPGRFTIPAEFAGMTLLKSWMVELAGKGPEYFDGQFDSLKYQQVSIKLWDFINSNKQYFWRRGETFPEKLSAMHQMFANNELDFTFSNNDAEVDNKIFQGVFPNTAKAYVPEVGSIQNSHYLGIPKNAGNKNAALMVINFLISPEAQYQKLQPKVWGDGTILDENKLDDFWKQKFVTSSGRINAPERRLINQKAIKEPAPEYMIRLYADFRNEVINQK
jgi:putative spermidine/putrescine transport system substrate-binding protein